MRGSREGTGEGRERKTQYLSMRIGFGEGNKPELQLLPDRGLQGLLTTLLCLTALLTPHHEYCITAL